MKEICRHFLPFGVALLLAGVLGMGCSLGGKKQAPPPPSAEAPPPAPKATEPPPSEVKAPEPLPPMSPPYPRAAPREPVPPLPSPPPAAPEPAEKTAFHTHTVRFSGESISIIASWYTGDLENWKALAAANPTIDPNRIFLGNKILIPENMLKTRELMPKEFVDSFYEKGRLRKPPAKATSPAAKEEKEKEEEPELFGPKSAPRK
ncbi:MAG: hypothetical protein H6Q42_358 [Deltaproteobacteria bacterium]|nr:hypothetical protein [Deltaproteobacteria bacterium]